MFFAWLNGNGSSAGGYNPRLGVPIKPGLLYSPTSLGYGGIGGILDYDVLDALDQQFYLTQRNGQSEWSRDYTVEEKVPVGYVKFNIDTQLGDVPLRGNVGVRFMHTDQKSQAFQTNGDTLVGGLTGGIKYNNVLPSLNLVAQLSEGQFLRFGFAKTMARGRIDDEKVASSAVVPVSNDSGQHRAQRGHADHQAGGEQAVQHQGFEFHGGSP